MWPEIPETLDGMTSAEVRALAAEITKALNAAPVRLTAETTPTFAEWDEYRQLAIQLNARANMLAEQEAFETPESDPETEVEDEPDEDADDEPEVDPDEEANGDGVAAGARPASLSIATNRQVVAVSNQWRSTGAVQGRKRNAGFESYGDLAEAVMTAAGAMADGAESRVDVARMLANFGERENPRLSSDPFENLSLFESMRHDDKALQAAFCAPATPLYDLACETTDRRPVRASLPVFQTPTRGAFEVFPSPTLADVSSGFGQWTSDDDADPEAIKEACATINCGTPTAYEIYAVYACLTVKNLVYMTFPELVAAYLNRLQAQRARLAETLLLEAMANSADTLDTFTPAYGANVSLKRIILTYLALYQEQERWDVDTADAWMPRWLLKALQIDALSRRTTDGSYPTVPSEAQINASFMDIGVTPHWYIDRPSWATPINDVGVNGDLAYLPSSVEILVARRGKYALMDRGDLTVGVSPNNIYRLSDDLRRNQFTFFFESFEGLIDTDSCPAHLLQIPNLCYNGAQIADIPIDCEGERAVIGS